MVIQIFKKLYGLGLDQPQWPADMLSALLVGVEAWEAIKSPLEWCM